MLICLVFYGLTTHVLKIVKEILVGLKIGFDVGGGVHVLQNFNLYVSFQIFGSKLVGDHLAF